MVAKTMPAIYALALSALAAITMEVEVEASSSPPVLASFAPFLRKLKSCPRHPSNKQWMTATNNQNNILGYKSCMDSSSHNRALKIRGGGIWGRSSEPREEQDQPIEESDADADYEYYEVDDNVEGEEYADYENYPEEDAMDVNDVDYEYYEEEEETSSSFGKVQDINGEFIDSDDDTGIVEEEDTVNSEENLDDEDAVIELEEKDVQGGTGWSFWGRGKRVMNEEAEADMDSDDVTNDEEYAVQNSDYENNEDVEEGGADIEEDEDYLFTTPIPAATPRKLKLANRAVPKTDMDIMEENEIEVADEIEYEENEYEYTEEGIEFNERSDDYLFETPIAKSQPKATSTTRKAPKASNPNNSHWWQHRPQTTGNKKSKRIQWRPTSSSKASFISPPFYSGASPRSFSLRSSNGNSQWLSSISTVVAAIIQPIGNGIQTITFSVTSTMSRWVSVSFSFVRNSFDFLWYGAVDGVTTTGLASREGGLSGFLLSSPVVIAVSSIVVLGLMTVLVRKLWIERAISRNKDMRRLDSYDDEDYTDDDTMDPPSVEEELEFLNREFDPANPSSKDRITEAITKQNRFNWPLRNRADRPKSKPRRGQHRGDGPKSWREQRQFTIKSIQTWWKNERPSQSIAIIEPQHLRNQQQPPNQEIKRLQKQLTLTEQERSILHQDVQRLQHKLQKAQHDARSVVSKNKWLEKQTSKADQILTKAVEVERKKANDEMGRVRESMKGVLERERMLMRGRVGGSERRDLGGQNDLDSMKGAPKRILDGVKIVREIDQVEEKDVESDRTWTAM